MLLKTCASCGGLKQCRESWASWAFFIIGMVATIAVRVVTVLAHFDPVYGAIAWYVGMFGFFIFFVYKFKVNSAYRKIIVERQLMDKIARYERLTQEDSERIGYILCALSSKKDRINYSLIFLSSAVAILVAIYFDFFK
jgi:hypothetical protein